jgi:hypothetical protein
MSACVQVSRTELGWPVGMSQERFSGLILPAGLKQPIWGLGEAEFPKRRAAGFTLLAGWCLTSN